MPRTWILVGESTRARLFEIPGAGREMREVQDFINPEGRARNRDLETDAHGRYYGKGERFQGHTTTQSMSAVEHDISLFAKELGDYLDKARAQSRFDSLYIVAAPKFLGLIRGALAKETLKQVTKELSKDLSRSSAKEVEEYVRGNPEFELEGGFVTNVPYR
jgi:protein required for attachment to host cells